MDLAVGQGFYLRVSWQVFFLLGLFLCVEAVWLRLVELELADQFLQSWTVARLCPPCPVENCSNEFSPPGPLPWLLRLLLR